MAIQAISFAITATLTRLLDPEAFGLVAIASVVTTMFSLLTRVGFGASIVVREVVDRRVVSTFLWAATAIGLLAAGLAVLLAVPTATLAGSSDAAALVAVSAITLPLGLAAGPFGSLLVRDLRFRATTAIEVGGMVAQGIVAIGLALAGAGPWAIVIGHVARSVYILVADVVVSGFRPALVFDVAVLREDLSFNLNLLARDALQYGNRNLDYWFVGNRLGTGALGVYYVAYVLPSLIRQRLNAIGHSVLFPVAAKLQSDMVRLGNAYLRVLRLASSLIFPIMLGLAVVSDLAIRIAFGPGWTEAIAPMRVIAVGSAVMGIGVVARPVFTAIGRPGITVASSSLGLAAFAIGLGLSWNGGTLVTVAAAAVAGSVVETVFLLVRARDVLRVGFRRQAGAMAPFVISALVMVAVVLGVRTVTADLPIALETVVAVVAGALAYLTTGLVAFRSQFLNELDVLRRIVRP